jgi:hypothetical protein
VRFERTESFKADYRRLTKEEQGIFRAAALEFSAACDRHVNSRTPFPGKFRAKDVKGAKGVLEMTWSFAGPDGRATWEWTTVIVGGATYPAVLWRRVGSHRIFSNP